MLLAPIPSDEEARLRALRDYDILDTPPEAAFDAITELAAMLLGVPIALVSLIDVDRQWFKSGYGLDVSSAPRDTSFCGHVVAAAEPVVVSDATRDERFADNPFVAGQPRVRFYVGVPLRAPDGSVLGALCGVDRAPREITASQLRGLTLLADQVMALLALRRAGRQLRAEQAALVESERELQAVFDSMVEGVVVQDRDGHVVQHNRAAETILRISEEQVSALGTSQPYRVSRSDGTPFAIEERPGRVALRTGEPVTDVVTVVHGQGGAERWLSVNARPLVRAGEPTPYAVVSTFHDITAQRLVADRLAVHQRLVTTGTLAAGVGHEINNPLTYMLANLDMAIEELEDVGGGSPSRRIVEVVDMLRQVQEGADRVKRIVRGLKSLVRDDAQAEPTDLARIVRGALDLASHELRARATVTTEIADLPPVLTDESRMTQVLINLVVNAAQAFTADAPERNHITIRGVRTGEQITVAVADNGPGIPPEVLPHIFDPFFTTKAPAVGTGLGLSISHGIVVALGGTLTCETRVGDGTTFRITLPIARAEDVEPPSRVTTRGTVWLVDDEPKILDTTRRMLDREFTVIALADPREAVRRLIAGEPCDAIFTDITMPYLTGFELYAGVVAARPELAARFVFVSGDLTRPPIREFLGRIPNARLEKPFAMDRIRAIARELVSRRA